MKLSGIILAGGKSSRMGTDKGWVELNGNPLIKHVIEHLKPICQEIIISANNSNYDELGYQVVKDSFKDIGPVSGIVEGLQHISYDSCFMISCDLPYVSTNLLRRLYQLKGNAEIAVPEVEGFIQPICGFYSKSILNDLLNEIKKGNHGMRYLLEMFNTKIIRQEEIPEINFSMELKNFNTPDDLRENI